eukprot:COSAG01_NODE_68428_length_264_cov_0.624242_1_plen_31_part_10
MSVQLSGWESSAKMQSDMHAGSLRTPTKLSV